jgi:hypothetical protein
VDHQNVAFFLLTITVTIVLLYVFADDGTLQRGLIGQDGCPRAGLTRAIYRPRNSSRGASKNWNPRVAASVLQPGTKDVSNSAATPGATAATATAAPVNTIPVQIQFKPSATGPQAGQATEGRSGCCHR